MRIGRLLAALVGVLALAVVILNWTYGRLPAEPKPTGAFATVGTLRIHYLEHPASDTSKYPAPAAGGHAGAGTPAHPGPGTRMQREAEATVVLIHGLPGTADDFDAVTPLLAGRRTIAIDRPGFGYSTGGYVPFERQLSAIHELLAKLHVSRPVIVGHSYGGTVALGYAERYPNDVRGLVLVDAAAAGTHPGGFERFQAHLVKALQTPVIRQIADATFAQLLLTVSAQQGDSEAFHPNSVIAAHRERLLSVNFTHSNLEALAGERLAAGGVVDLIDRRLSTIAVPAVVIQGDGDQLVKPRYGRRLASELPHARLVMVSGGHMVPYTHPAAIAEAVKSIAR